MLSGFFKLGGGTELLTGCNFEAASNTMVWRYIKSSNTVTSLPSFIYYLSVRTVCTECSYGGNV